MDKKSKVKGIVVYLIELVVLVVVTHLFFTKVVRPVSIIGSSMYPTVHDNDLALINVIGLKESSLKRFDVVVAYCEEDQENIIKRVIGFPGETIKYENDVLYIDGVKYEEDFLDKDYVEAAKRKYGTNVFTEDFETVVPEWKYFILGDNRLNSKDSRYFGAFDFEDFLGKDGVVIYPFNHFDWIV